MSAGGVRRSPPAERGTRCGWRRSRYPTESCRRFDGGPSPLGRWSPGDPANLEECESGRIGTLGKRVTCKGPWVRIPPPPQGVLLVRALCERLSAARRRDLTGVGSGLSDLRRPDRLPGACAPSAELSFVRLASARLSGVSSCGCQEERAERCSAGSRRSSTLAVRSDAVGWFGGRNLGQERCRLAARTMATEAIDERLPLSAGVPATQPSGGPKSGRPFVGTCAPRPPVARRRPAGLGRCPFPPTVA